jgi:hypothetical protein
MLKQIWLRGEAKKSKVDSILSNLGEIRTQDVLEDVSNAAFGSCSARKNVFSTFSFGIKKTDLLPSGIGGDCFINLIQKSDALWCQYVIAALSIALDGNDEPPIEVRNALQRYLSAWKLFLLNLSLCSFSCVKE